MEGPEGLYITQDILTIATDYCKELLKFECTPDISISSNFVDVEDRVTTQENATLEAPFASDEI
jgi:hypothetical protein